MSDILKLKQDSKKKWCVYNYYDKKIASTKLMLFNANCIDVSDLSLHNKDIFVVIIAILFGKLRPRRINLSKNHFGEHVLKYIELAIASVKRLDTVMLDCNRIEDKGILALSTGIKETKFLCVLYLRSNLIGIDGFRVLSDALKTNTSIKRIYLDDNYAGAQGFDLILDMLKVNRTITFIGMRRNRINLCTEQIDKLVSVLQENHVIECIDLRDNLICPENIERVKHLLLLARVECAIERIEARVSEMIDYIERQYHHVIQCENDAHVPVVQLAKKSYFDINSLPRILVGKTEFNERLGLEEMWKFKGDIVDVSPPSFSDITSKRTCYFCNPPEMVVLSECILSE